MTKSVDEMAASLIKNLEEKTGKTLAEWVEIARKSDETKHMKILKYLRDNFDLTYGYANVIAAETLKPAGAAPKSAGDMVTDQYSAKPNLRPIYDALVEKVQEFGEDVEISPKKAYVSLRRSKQFALVQPSTKTRVDVGIKIKGLDPTDRLEASGSFNSMVTHRVRITELSQVDEELFGWLRLAYEEA